MDYLSVAQAAKQLKTSPQMVRRWIREGQLEAEEIASVYLLRREIVASFQRVPRGRPRAIWFKMHARDKLWHCTSRMTADENGQTFCGRPFDLTGTSSTLPAGSARPLVSGNETVCVDCTDVWKKLMAHFVVKAMRAGRTR